MGFSQRALEAAKSKGCMISLLAGGAAAGATSVLGAASLLVPTACWEGGTAEGAGEEDGVGVVDVVVVAGEEEEDVVVGAVDVVGVDVAAEEGLGFGAEAGEGAADVVCDDSGSLVGAIRERELSPPKGVKDWPAKDGGAACSVRAGKAAWSTGEAGAGGRAALSPWSGAAAAPGGKPGE